MNSNYPEKPNIDSSTLTKVTASYKSHVVKVLISIIWFMIGYLLILGAAVLLIYLGGWAAIYIISIKAHWITLLLGAGIMMTVLMFFFFLIKFLFTIKKDENPDRIEVTKKDQPELIEFIYKVCEETQAVKPKKIFVSANVNACVFYNSSFLSMFFPVKKNLEIGLGLVNTLNISQFKAVVAHEFGHFSQSSTKLGSYIYRLNKMIHNLLYDNDGWSETLNSISSFHAIISFFGNLTIQLVNFVLKLLIKLYEIVNISYMSLSREMEFHADLVAVSVSGSENIINALYRIEFADSIYNYSLTGIKENYEKEKKLPINFYKIHSRNISSWAKNTGLKTENDLPIINTKIYNQYFIPNRIEFKDEWASHPPTKEREKNASNKFIKADEIKASAWILFRDTEKLQEEVSKKLYENHLNIKTKNYTSEDSYNTFFEAKEKETYTNPIYCGFYDNAGNTYSVPDETNQELIISIKNLTFDELFNERIVSSVKSLKKLNQDIVNIKAINDGQIKVKKFEFDGVTHSIDDSVKIYSQLKKEERELEKWLQDHKSKIANWFYLKLNKKDANDYKALMQLRKILAADREPFLTLFNNLYTFYFSIQNDPDEVYTGEKKLQAYGATFLGAKAGIKDIEIPTICINNGLLLKGYKNSLMEVEVKTNFKDINSLIPFIQDMEKLIEHFASIDEGVFKLILKLQDKALE